MRKKPQVKKPARKVDVSAAIRAARPTPRMRRAMMRDGLRPNEIRDQAFRRVIRSIPKGKVATYGQVAAAAGYPLYHRAVARLLRYDPPNTLPWQRVLGAGEKSSSGSTPPWSSASALNSRASPSRANA